MTDLPPLPTHVGEEYHGPSQSPVKLYDADQLRAYALAERAAERERCAELCKGIAVTYTGEARRLKGQFATLAAGHRDGANECAAAIRSAP